MYRFILGCLTLLCTIIIIAEAQRKPGDCPPPSGVSVCSITCRNDGVCRGDTKCCRTACGGSACMRPVTQRKPQTLKVKPGHCPDKPSGPWVCSSRCAFDGDCRGSKKCCKNRCKAMACMKPEGI